MLEADGYLTDLRLSREGIRLKNPLAHGKLDHIRAQQRHIRPSPTPREVDPLERRGARVAESDGLENRSRGNSTVGSNPTLSATHAVLRHEC